MVFNIRKVKNNVLFILLAIGLKLQAQSIVPSALQKDFPANPLKKAGWKLTVHDEFSGLKLNEQLWIPFYLQHRTETDVRSKYALRDGCLVLTVKGDDASAVQTFERTDLHKPGIRQVPAKINFVQQYGYFEIRAKSQIGAGHCTAFWLIGVQDIPAHSAEIDVMEQPGHLGSFTAMSSLHLWKDSSIAPNTPEKRDFGQKFSTAQDLTKTFNIYGLEWTPTDLKYYLNNRLMYTIPRSPQYPMGVIISFYQGDKSWYGPLDRSIPDPKEFVIDYFRAYSRE